MSDISPRTPNVSATAAEILTDAINAAHLLGITVSTDTRLGVRCPSTEAPRWERDPRCEAVSCLGAVLLHAQPRIPLADDALIHVFGSKMLYHLGIEEGCAGYDQSENLTRGLDAQLYRDGWVLGKVVRTFLATSVCEPHRIRFPRGGRCGHCAAGVPIPRSDDEITLTIVTDVEV